MGQILVHEFVTLDGVYEDPGWTREFAFDPAMGAAIGGLMGASEGLLLGRRTYELFAPAWSGRTEPEHPGATFMNESPKHVVSSTLRDPQWANSQVLGAYDADAVRALKQRAQGGLYVSGSGTLVRAMLADGLLDELHLFVYPLVLGAGERLFGDGPQTGLELAGAESFDSGVVHLAYRPSASPA